MKAYKNNKVYTINEVDKSDYINKGFDIKDNDGNVIAYGKGKTVAYEKYVELQKKLENVTVENRKLLEKLDVLQSKPKAKG